MTLFQDFARDITRRHFFAQGSHALGWAALTSLMGRGALAAPDAKQGAAAMPGRTHFPGKAKHVIYLHMVGGPSHVDLFDPKPVMRATAGKNIPDSVRGMTRLSTMSSGYGKWPTLPAIKPFKTLNYFRS